MTELKLGGEGPTRLELDLVGKSSRLGNGNLAGIGQRKIWNICHTTPYMINLYFGGGKASYCQMEINLISVVCTLLNVTEYRPKIRHCVQPELCHFRTLGLRTGCWLSPKPNFLSSKKGNDDTHIMASFWIRRGNVWKWLAQLLAHRRRY